MSRAWRASGSSARAAVNESAAGAGTGDLVGRRWKSAGDGIGRAFRVLATTGVTAGPPRVQQKNLSLGVNGRSSGTGSSRSSGGWPSSGGKHGAANSSCGGSASSGQSDGVGNGHGAAVGTHGRHAWTGNCGAAATAGIAGVIGTAGERGTSSVARDSEGAGVGGWGDKGVTGVAGSGEGGRARGTGSGGNEAAKESDLLATSCYGKTSCRARLKSSQLAGSARASLVSANESHKSPST